MMLKYAGIVLIINIVTYLLYGWDKRCAKKGMPRIPEMGLLLAAFAGGSPAAFIAMRVFRHKTRKTGFQIAFWLIVAFQIYYVGGKLLYNYE